MPDATRVDVVSDAAPGVFDAAIADHSSRPRFNL
jgi:hypothetical protein